MDANDNVDFDRDSSQNFSRLHCILLTTTKPRQPMKRVNWLTAIVSSKARHCSMIYGSGRVRNKLWEIGLCLSRKYCNTESALYNDVTTMMNQMLAKPNPEL
ncbi:hypothetical protein WN51_04954 [Melipona quadrifasciata]|uniref:Uncharacterized protein n=1 Tax=Melipona quadrifasciata TaxID=166423 RepID=A0A0N0BD58_9HYME|nr:hypothetical protein WN51_04954 [Melipona quadrifasciata]